MPVSAEYARYQTLMRRGQFQEAAGLAETAYLEGQSDNPFWLIRQAAALSRSGMHDRALMVARQGLSMQPANAYGILAVAEALKGLRQPTEALVYFEEIGDHEKLAAHARWGILACLSDLKRWDEILERLSALDWPPERDLPWRVKALAGQQRLAEAIAACGRWLELVPDNRHALWSLTEIEITRDGLEAVLKKMGRMARIPSRPAIYQEIYASLCRRAGKPELAVAQYEKMTRHSADPKIERKRAFAMARTGREDEAVPLLEELLLQDPGDFFMHSSYMGACRRIKELERALAFYEKLIQRHPYQKGIYGRMRQIKNLMEIKP